MQILICSLDNLKYVFLWSQSDCLFPYNFIQKNAWNVCSTFHFVTTWLLESARWATYHASVFLLFQFEGLITHLANDRGKGVFKRADFARFCCFLLHSQWRVTHRALNKGGLVLKRASLASDQCIIFFCCGRLLAFSRWTRFPHKKHLFHYYRF